MIVMKSEEINLDKIVAEVGFKLAENFKDKDDVKKFENVVTKALSVLVEDGLFAFAVWLKSREDMIKYSEKIINACLELLKNRLQIITTEITTENSEVFIDIISNNISESLEKTLFVKQLLERMLIYARYRAKAFQKSSIKQATVY